MAINNYGFAGTINAAQWSVMATLLGNQSCVMDGSSFAVTPVSGQRQVSISLGTAFADGVMTVSTAAEVRTVSVPTNGQWFLLVLRRTWATATADFALLASDTTTTSFPTSPPASYPAMNANPGVVTDQPLAWVWSNSANTTLQIVDVRTLPVRSYVNEPNDFINGAFDHWQRGISFASTTLNAYTADRWLAESNVASLATVSRQPFTPGECPGGFEARYFMRFQRSGSNPTGTSYLRHRINDVRTKAGKTVTFSFYARNSVVSTESVPFYVTQNFGTSGSTSVVLQGQIGTLSTAWTRYTVTIALGKLSGKTIGENSYLEFAIGITSPFGLNSMDFWGYQDDTGTVPATFRRHAPSVLAELSACYPYYAILGIDQTGDAILLTGCWYETNALWVPIVWPTPMRAKPTITINGTIQAYGGGGSSVVISVQEYAGGVPGKQGGLYRFITSMSNNVQYRAGMIGMGNAGNTIAFSAEL